MTKYFIGSILYLIPFISLFAQDNSEQEKQLIKNPRQLIYEGKRSGEGYFSQDGKMMVFQSERDDSNPFYQIYTLDFESGDILRVSPGIGKTTCAFFGENNNKVLFASTHLDPKAKQKQKEELDFRASGKKRRYSWDYDETMDIFTSDADGKNIKQLTKAKGYDAEASYSPDGSKIAFCSLRDAYGKNLNDTEKRKLEMEPSYFGEIYIMDADGSNQKRLTTTAGYDGGPFFSPDGNRIVWRRFDETGHIADIFTMKLDGSDVQQVTDFKTMSWAPYYHPSGDYIIFASNKLGYSNFELFIVDAAGTKEPVRVTYTDGFDGLPVFHPDGKHLSWTSNRTADGKSQVFYADWDHTAAISRLDDAPSRGANGEGDAFTGEIKADELKEKVVFLADDKLEGRMTGSEGIKQAAEYSVRQFDALGLQAIGSEGYTQSFPFISSIENVVANTNLSVTKIGKKGYQQLQFDDVVPLSFSKNGKEKGGVVFAGYGIKTPDGPDFSYNSYNNIDVKGKVVLVLEGMPAYFDKDQERAVIRYASTRYKALVARELGAKAIIVITGNTQSGIKQEKTPGNAGILAVKISKGYADALLEVKEITVNELKQRLEENNPHLENAFALEGVFGELSVELKKVEGQDDNVIGMIPSGTGSDQYIIIGGHYDHLGHGEVGSLADKTEIHQIHNGADDNASGTAVVIELAEYFSQLKKKDPKAIAHNLVFILWSGEEMGLVGSSYFTKNSPIPLDKAIAYLNFDMVGRLSENKLVLQGLGSAEGWKKLVEKKNILAGFNLVLQDDPYVPTDAMSLYLEEVPILCFFTGIHDDYHKPSDDVNLIDHEGMERIAKFAADLLKEVMANPSEIAYNKVEMSATKEGASRGFSVYLGTIPDYASTVIGVQLSGVREGGPADKAGLQKGDIILKLADRDIKDIYDYTYILGDLKPDVTVDMLILRGEEKLTLSITPIAK